MKIDKEILYKFKNEETKTKFAEVLRDKFECFLKFLANEYKSKEIVIDTVNVYKYYLGNKETCISSVGLDVFMDNRLLNISFNDLNADCVLQDKNIEKKYVETNDGFTLVSTCYNFTDNNVKIIFSKSKVREDNFYFSFSNGENFIVKIESEYSFEASRGRIINYFRHNKIDSPRITTLLNILTKLVDVNKCKIRINSGEDNLIVYDHGTLLNYKETIKKENEVLVLSMYFNGEEYIEEKNVKKIINPSDVENHLEEMDDNSKVLKKRRINR